MKPLHQARGSWGSRGTRASSLQLEGPLPPVGLHEALHEAPRASEGESEGNGGSWSAPSPPRRSSGSPSSGADQLLGTERTSALLQLRGRGSPPAPLSGGSDLGCPRVPLPPFEKTRGGAVREGLSSPSALRATFHDRGLSYLPVPSRGASSTPSSPSSPSAVRAETAPERQSGRAESL